MSNVIPFPAKVEISQTDEQIKGHWFGHGKRGEDRWMVVMYYDNVPCQALDGTMYRSHCSFVVEGTVNYQRLKSLACR